MKRSRKLKSRSRISATSMASEVLILERLNSRLSPLSPPPTHPPPHISAAPTASSVDTHSDSYDEDLGGEDGTIMETTGDQVSETIASGDNPNLSIHVTRQQSVINLMANPAYNHMKMVRENQRRGEELEGSQQQADPENYDYPRITVPQPYLNPRSLMEISRASRSGEVPNSKRVASSIDSDAYEN